MPVFVVGSINVDLVAYCERMPQVGESVRGLSFERHPGGKGANQAVAAARAGTVALMVGAVGDDPHGVYMRDTLRGYGVDIHGVETVADATGVAVILVGGGDNRIVVVPGANERIAAGRVAALDFQPGDVCMAQLETRVEVVRTAFERARAKGAITLLNPAPALPEAAALFPLADVIVMNETECAAFTGMPVEAVVSAESARIAARRLGLLAGQVLVITLGAQGAVAYTGERLIGVPGHAVDVIDTTGAGDCFCGYLAAELARGGELEAALKEANAAAALAVQTKGAASAIPERGRVLEFLAAAA